jgi:hypothetical protein
VADEQRSIYRPSNGTEGLIFMRNFCFRCKKEKECKILPATLFLEADDEGYPKEWTWVPVDMSTPSCSEFEEES